ncbi:hypothetical protein CAUPRSCDRAFT_10464 [Caulochytrium protostelioides]|uniref:RGS domain-containing protein n=1 Tax=Caulochytrium protostelioides TaxID=1555241 RepID=A0A4P9WWT3_9FUNG|nr:hypothetical protein CAUPRSCDRAFT_10464 [Caulochytrium protostelioides]
MPSPTASFDPPDPLNDAVENTQARGNADGSEGSAIQDAAEAAPAPLSIDRPSTPSGLDDTMAVNCPNLHSSEPTVATHHIEPRADSDGSGDGDAFRGCGAGNDAGMATIDAVIEDAPGDTGGADHTLPSRPASSSSGQESLVASERHNIDHDGAGEHEGREAREKQAEHEGHDEEHEASPATGSSRETDGESMASSKPLSADDSDRELRDAKDDRVELDETPAAHPAYPLREPPATHPVPTQAAPTDPAPSSSASSPAPSAPPSIRLNLPDLLDDKYPSPYSRDDFHAYLKKELACEHLEFCEAVRAYHAQYERLVFEHAGAIGVIQATPISSQRDIVASSATVSTARETLSPTAMTMTSPATAASSSTPPAASTVTTTTTTTTAAAAAAAPSVEAHTTPKRSSFWSHLGRKKSNPDPQDPEPEHGGHSRGHGHGHGHDHAGGGCSYPWVFACLGPFRARLWGDCG